MEKLKKKIIVVLLLILTFFLVGILCIFNYQYYNNEKSRITNSLIRVDERIGRQPFNINDRINDNPIYMDVTMYTIFYNNENEVIDILNHSNNDISNDEIEKTAENILSKKHHRISKIGNLYFNKYSYSFKEHNKLVIIDNSNAQEGLVSLLKTSIIIFLLLEILIIIVTLKITNWIIRPVIESFNKQKAFISDSDTLPSPSYVNASV